jgi:hypothetical protein
MNPTEAAMAGNRCLGNSTQGSTLLNSWVHVLIVKVNKCMTRRGSELQSLTCTVLKLTRVQMANVVSLVIGSIACPVSWRTGSNCQQCPACDQGTPEGLALHVLTLCRNSSLAASLIKFEMAASRCLDLNTTTQIKLARQHQ